MKSSIQVRTHATSPDVLERIVRALREAGCFLSQLTWSQVEAEAEGRIAFVTEVEADLLPALLAGHQAMSGIHQVKLLDSGEPAEPELLPRQSTELPDNHA